MSGGVMNSTKEKSRDENNVGDILAMVWQLAC